MPDIETLQREYDGMLADRDDYPGDWSVNKAKTYAAKRQQLGNLIHIAVAQATLQNRARITR